eukprot:756092-Hanusia_phi.AAC.8
MQICIVTPRLDQVVRALDQHEDDATSIERDLASVCDRSPWLSGCRSVAVRKFALTRGHPASNAAVTRGNWVGDSVHVGAFCQTYALLKSRKM